MSIVASTWTGLGVTVVGGLAAILAVAYVSLHILWRKRRVTYSDGTVVPCVPVSFPFGSVNHLFSVLPGSKASNQGRIHRVHTAWFEKFNDTAYQGFLGNRPILVVGTRKMASDLYAAPTADLRPQSPIGDFLWRDLGVVFISDIPKWSAHRKACLTGLMKPRILKAVANQVTAPVLREFFQWVEAGEADGEGRFTIDIVAAIHRVTTEVIARASMSTSYGLLKVDGTDARGARIYQSLTEVLKGFALYLRTPPFWMVYKDKAFKAFSAWKDVWFGSMRQAVEDRRAAGVGEALDFLDVLLTSQAEELQSNAEGPSQWTDDDVTYTLGDLVGAGLDTTGHLLCWCVYYLLQYPEFAERLRDEANAVIGPTGREVAQYDNIGDLKYTERFIKEVLRLRPSVPHNPRRLSAPAQIGDIHVPAGFNVFVSMWHLGRDPAVYDDPLEFRPDRWEDAALPLPFVFGAGARSCIGERFAYLESKAALAALVRRYNFFEVTPLPEVEEFTSITMAPWPEFQVQVEPVRP